MKKKRGLTFWIAMGRWGGFHISCSKSGFHICLGWVALCIAPFDIEEVLSKTVQRLQILETENQNIDGETVKMNWNGEKWEVIV